MRIFARKTKIDEMASKRLHAYSQPSMCVFYAITNTPYMGPNPVRVTICRLVSIMRWSSVLTNLGAKSRDSQTDFGATAAEVFCLINMNRERNPSKADSGKLEGIGGGRH